MSKPFHESIVKAIGRVAGSAEENGEDMVALLMLIKGTKIPANHDKIIHSLETSLWHGTDLAKKAIEHVRREQKEAEERAAESAEDSEAQQEDEGG